MIKLKNPSEIKKMRNAGSLLAEAFLTVFDSIKAGVKTIEIDRMMEEVIRQNNGVPAFKGYKGGAITPFPGTICISVDDEIVHGIPSERVLQDGNLVTVDSGLVLDGWYSDMAFTFQIGEVSKVKQNLCRVTKEALYIGIDQARAGRTISDIGSAIQDWVERNGFSVIRDLIGHGIGCDLHEEPAVPNYRSYGQPVKLKPGMTIAIEPMVSAGKWQIKTLKDGWTAATKDGSPSAHYEHTVLVTDGEPEILTKLKDGRDPWAVATQNMSEINA